MSAIYRSIHALALTVAALAILFVSAAEVQARSGAHPAPWVGKRLDGRDCKSIQIGAGPWDYLQRAKYPGPLEVTEDSHFDEGVDLTAFDSSGDNDGTLRGGVAWADPGKIGKALSFDGVDDWVDVPDSASQQLGTESFTIEAFLKADSFSSIAL